MIYIATLSQQSSLAQWSAYPPPDPTFVGSNLGSAKIFLSPVCGDFVTEVRLRTPASNVFSVAEWLALLRCQWWCRDSVGALGSHSRLNAVGSLAKSRRSLESGRMGNTSPRQPQRRYSTWPQIWRSARQEVALQTPHPVWSGELKGGFTMGIFMFFCFFFKVVNAFVDTGSRG